MQANLDGRLKKSRLSPKHGLWPVFEAAVNSLQSVEARKATDGKIRVHIVRNSSQAQIAEVDIPRPIHGFRITDNGQGFTPENFKSFETYDSPYKFAQGGKGIGRLLYLVAFEEAKIDSHYKLGDEIRHRSFRFTVPANGISDMSDEQVESGEIGTIVELIGFKKQYREATDSNATAIAEALLEHCLPYFFHDNCPIISVTDDDNSTQIVLNDEYRLLAQTGRTQKKFQVGTHDFEINHLRLRHKTTKDHALHFCAHKRSVIRKRLTKEIPNLGSKLADDQGEWGYVGYVSGDYLDRTANAERTNFDFPKDEGLLQDDVTEESFTKSALGAVETELAPQLSKTRTDLKARVAQVIEQEMPDARAVLRNLDAFVKVVNPTDNPATLRRRINEAKFVHEMDVQESVTDLIAKCENVDQAKLAAESILAEVTETSKNKLSGYVAFRKAVLQIYRKLIGLQSDGKFSREDAVHDLIFPRKSTSDSISFDDHNLWIIDDRLAFHHLLASDLPLSEIKALTVAGEGAKKRPDLLVVNRPTAFANTDEISSIVIVELKRPQRDNFNDEENPILQVFEYIENIRSGKAHKPDGVAIDIKPQIPFFIYIVADATPTLKKQIQHANIFTATPDAGGYFGYAKDYNAYIEIMSFEKLIRDAEKKNFVWFKHLGIS